MREEVWVGERGGRVISLRRRRVVDGLIMVLLLSDVFCVVVEV